MKKAKGARWLLLPSCFDSQLLGGSGLGGGGGFAFLALVPVVLLLELFDAARRVDELHLAGEEGVTDRADFGLDVLLRAAGRELVAATAANRGFFILGGTF